MLTSLLPCVWPLLSVSSAVGIPRYQSHSSVCDRKDFVLNFNGISTFHPSAGGSYYHHHHHHHPQSVCQDIKPCVMWALTSLRTWTQRETAGPSHDKQTKKTFKKLKKIKNKKKERKKEKKNVLFFFLLIFDFLEDSSRDVSRCHVLASSVQPQDLWIYALKEMNEEPPQRPLKQTTSPIWTLTSVFFFTRSFRNTTF